MTDPVEVPEMSWAELAEYVREKRKKEGMARQADHRYCQIQLAVNSRGPFPGTTSFFNRPSQIIICGPWVHWHLFIPCHGHYLKGQFGAKGLESII